MRYCWLAFAMLLAASLLGSTKDAAEDLQHKIDAAQGGKKARLLMELAQDQLEQADKLYRDGDSTKAESVLQLSTNNANAATSASLDSGKRLKDTEIELRKFSERMQAIRQDLNFDDRKAMDGSIQQVEQDRGKLLDRMFKK